MTRIGIISAFPDEDWDARRIAEAASEAGHCEILAPTDFGATIGADGAWLTVRAEDVRAYDVFLTPRAIGDEGDVELQLELYRTLAECGVPVVNDVRALVIAIDKFKSSFVFARAGLPTPEVVVAQRLDEAYGALERMGRVVFKPVFGSLGNGVELIEAGERGAARLAELLCQHRALYLQAFIDDAGRDLRAFVVGDRVVAAIEREPALGDFRGNLHAGARARAVELEAGLGRLAVAAARAIGLDYSGVDLLVGERAGAQLLEVNGTPSFRGLERATGEDVARSIVAQALRRARQRIGVRAAGNFVNR